MPKNKECRAPGGEIYLTYILSSQRLISRKKRSDLKRSSISQLHLEAAFHTSIPAVMSHQPGHTGETHTVDYQRLMGCPS